MEHEPRTLLERVAMSQLLKLYRWGFPGQTYESVNDILRQSFFWRSTAYYESVVMSLTCQILVVPR